MLNLSKPLSRAAGASYEERVQRFVRVALPVPLGRAFTYEEPVGMTATPGCRVLVQLGRRPCLGVVVESGVDPPSGFDLKKIKPLLQVLDVDPALSPELLSFLLELARYYLAPIGEVLRLALPALERATAEEIAKLSGKKFKAVGQLVQVAEWASTAPRPPNARGHTKEILRLLEERGSIEVSELGQRFSSARSIVKKLERAGCIKIVRQLKAVDPFFSKPAERDVPPTLNAGQTRAVDELCSQLAAHTLQQRAFLLDGVTASGKTEVYLHAAVSAVARGGGVILLVPEIALTPQLVGRFRARLGDAIAVLHSGLSEPARLEMWRSLRSGNLRVVVGARSALFAPVQNLKLICVDEEHDASYKQEEGVRYNARDMALLRAARAGAVCVLGSATPSLASEAAVLSGKLVRLELTERARPHASLPEVEILDLKRFGPGPSGDALLSLPLHRALEENLAAGGQSILFLNRRGFSPSVLCGSCGTIVECPNCSVALTLHRARGIRLECHYCDLQMQVPERCPACDGEEMLQEGLGTEKVEDLLRIHFPTARVARLDRDVASGQHGEQTLERMRRRELDILVGTQMVTKGHDLPNVTLVGVLNADAALSLPDFRAAERTFQLLVQVAGRAGRAERTGRVFIQTRNPAHPAIQFAARHDVRSFVEYELASRQEVGYPPFSHVALVRFDGLLESAVQKEAARVARVAELASPEAEILGPAKAPLARLRNRYRYRFLVRSETRAAVRKALLAVARAATDRAVRVAIDVDPMSLL